jgi:hypothetical protein
MVELSHEQDPSGDHVCIRESGTGRAKVCGTNEFLTILGLGAFGGIEAMFLALGI